MVKGYVGDIHDKLEGQGFSVVSVRLKNGAYKVFLDDAATDAQRVQAQAVADAFRPNRRHKLRGSITDALVLHADDPDDPEALAIIQEAAARIRARVD